MLVVIMKRYYHDSGETKGFYKMGKLQTICWVLLCKLFREISKSKLTLYGLNTIMFIATFLPTHGIYILPQLHI